MNKYSDIWPGNWAHSLRDSDYKIHVAAKFKKEFMDIKKGRKLNKNSTTGEHDCTNLNNMHVNATNINSPKHVHFKDSLNNNSPYNNRKRIQIDKKNDLFPINKKSQFKNGQGETVGECQNCLQNTNHNFSANYASNDTKYNTTANNSITNLDCPSNSSEADNHSATAQGEYELNDNDKSHRHTTCATIPCNNGNSSTWLSHRSISDSSDNYSPCGSPRSRRIPKQGKVLSDSKTRILMDWMNEKMRSSDNSDDNMQDDDVFKPGTGNTFICFEFYQCCYSDDLFLVSYILKFRKQAVESCFYNYLYQK